jgi:hypothetical protein
LREHGRILLIPTVRIARSRRFGDAAARTGTAVGVRPERASEPAVGSRRLTLPPRADRAGHLTAAPRVVTAIFARVDEILADVRPARPPVAS